MEERLFWVLGGFLVACATTIVLAKLERRQNWGETGKAKREKEIGKTGF